MKVEHLLEALRFGFREMQYIDSTQARNILIGIEYEFHLANYDENAISEDDVEELVVRRYQEREEEAREEAIERLISDIEDDVEVVANHIKELVSIIPNGLEESITRFEEIQRDNSIGEDISEHHQFLLEFSKEMVELERRVARWLLNYPQREYEDVSRPYLDDDVSELYEEALEMADDLGDIDTPTFTDVNDDEFDDWLRDADYSSAKELARNAHNNGSMSYARIAEVIVRDARDNARNIAEDNWQDFVEWDEDREWHEAHEWVYLNHNISSGQDDVEYIKDLLEEEGGRFGIDYDRHIEEVTEDSSVEGGAEVITKPLLLKEAMKVMEGMFGFIDDYGITSTKTGMHVNMSIRGKKFSRETFNPTKLLMLLDERFLREGGKVGDTKIFKYPIRDYVDKALRLDLETTWKMAGLVAQNRIEEFIELFESQISVHNKYQSINFRHMFDMDIEVRRIEFRYFGGEGYEKRYQEMRKDIYHAAYAMLAAFDDKFAQKEYYLAIIRALNAYVRTVGNRRHDFMDLVDYARKDPHVHYKNVIEFLNET